jgi:hypothetical protein
MGWTSTADPMENVARTSLVFYTKEEAIAFANKHGWQVASVQEPNPRRTDRQKRFQGYGDKFRWAQEAQEAPPLGAGRAAGRRRRGSRCAGAPGSGWRPLLLGAAAGRRREQAGADRPPPPAPRPLQHQARGRAGPDDAQGPQGGRQDRRQVGDRRCSSRRAGGRGRAGRWLGERQCAASSACGTPRPAAGAAAARSGACGVYIYAWCEALVKEAGILLLPASVYDHPEALARGHFRLGLGRADCVQKLALLRARLVEEAEAEGRSQGGGQAASADGAAG